MLKIRGNMNARERREFILKDLIESDNAIKGIILANKYNVTRQIVVKDVAILRAEGNKIVATPDGYIIEKENDRVKRIIAVNHKDDKLVEELEIIIKHRGIVEDVIVEHPIYGEIKGMLMIKNLYDLKNFIKKYKENNAKLLSLLTDGVHIHTITTDTAESMESILRELREKGFIIE